MIMIHFSVCGGNKKNGFSYNSLFSKVTYSKSYTDGVGCHAGCRPAHQEQFGVQYLAQEH